MPDTPIPATETTVLVLPAQANHYGTLFAGEALSMMTGAGYAAASRHAQGNVVLASVEGARFTLPVPVGHLLHLRAQVLETRRSTLRVEVIAHREDPATGIRQQVAQAEFSMVAVNEHGRPRKIT